MSLGVLMQSLELWPCGLDMSTYVKSGPDGNLWLSPTSWCHSAFEVGDQNVDSEVLKEEVSGPNS